MGLLPVFYTPAGLVACAGCVGVFFASTGPVNAEVCFIIVRRPALYSFGFGFVVLVSGAAWILGAPAAGYYYMLLWGGDWRWIGVW